MGLRQLLVSIAATLATSQCLAGSPVLEQQAWPAARTCKVCVPLQFGELDMRLPLADIGKILVISSEFSGLTIIPKSGDASQSVEFLTVPPERLLKHYEAKGLLKGLTVKTNEQLFDAMGQLPGDNRSLTLLRKIEGIDVAAQYTKTTQGPLHVYWIRSPLPGGSQRIYFIIDGDDIVYLLAGNVTHELYEEVLANLKVTKVP